MRLLNPSDHFERAMVATPELKEYWTWLDTELTGRSEGPGV